MPDGEMQDPLEAALRAHDLRRLADGLRRAGRYRVAVDDLLEAFYSEVVEPGRRTRTRSATHSTAFGVVHSRGRVVCRHADRRGAAGVSPGRPGTRRAGSGGGTVSSTLTVYAVSFDRLRRVPDSRDPGLAEAIGTEFGYFLSRIDELKKDEDEEVPTCREAVGQIIAGATLSPRLGYLYGYALEAICAYLGPRRFALGFLTSENKDGTGKVSTAATFIAPNDYFLGRGLSASECDRHPLQWTPWPSWQRSSEPPSPKKPPDPGLKAGRA